VHIRPESGANVLLIGTLGTGRTHLATGLARAAAHAGYRTYFTTADNLAAPPPETGSR